MAESMHKHMRKDWWCSIVLCCAQRKQNNKSDVGAFSVCMCVCLPSSCLSRVIEVPHPSTSIMPTSHAVPTPVQCVACDCDMVKQAKNNTRQNSATWRVCGNYL